MTRSAELDFEALARLEPRLFALWEICREAAPDAHLDDDELDDDPYAGDAFDRDATSSSWCAEHYFLRTVKPLLVQLVGWERVDGPAELRGREAYDTVYKVLFRQALRRTCACCRASESRLGG